MKEWTFPATFSQRRNDTTSFMWITILTPSQTTAWDLVARLVVAPLVVARLMVAPLVWD